MNDFYIACCETCGLIISDNLRGGNNKDNIILDFKKNHQLKGSNEEIFEIIKTVFHNKLANDKYGINNLKEII